MHDRDAAAEVLQRDANAAMAYAKITGEIRLQLSTGIAAGGESGYTARRLASELETALMKHANDLAADAERAREDAARERVGIQPA